MDQQKLKMMIDSYGIDKLLELEDISPEKALEVLINEGLIDIENYFNLDEDEF
jgi:hypothetical protein